MPSSIERLVAGARALGSREKTFHHPWVGHATLNRLGLHVARIALSDVMLALRGALVASDAEARAARDQLARDGAVMIPSFLDEAAFTAVRDEATRQVERSKQAVALPEGSAVGFGPKQPFPGGFDRFDGSSLNRFLELDPAGTPRCLELVRSARIARLSRVVTGMVPRASKFYIQLLRHGVPTAERDIQKDLHRDTFHGAYKLWFYLDDVRPEHGTFEYVRGSHRMSSARYRWEYRRSLDAMRLDSESQAGSFRIDPDELTGLGLPQPEAFTAPLNTLLIADVRGFHRRGEGRPGMERLALHANLRPHPFAVRPR